MFPVGGAGAAEAKPPNGPPKGEPNCQRKLYSLHQGLT
jgi:hypothetical protein